MMDVWHFEYFRVVCIKELSSYLGTNIWESLLLRAALSESCILNGILALGALSRNATSGGVNGKSTLAPGFPVGYSLRKYNEAIRDLSRRLAVAPGNWELAILGSLIFIAIENFQGNYDAARVHLHGALAILESHSDPTLGSSPTTSTMAQILGAISRCQGRSFRLRDHSKLTMPDFSPLPSAFTSISQARDVLNSITGAMKSVLWEARQESQQVPTLPLSLDMVKNSSRLSSLLESWHTLFTKFIAEHIMDARTTTCTKVLLIHYHVSRISAATEIYQTEMAYDIHMPAFSQIIELATQILDVEKAARNKSPASTPGHPYHIAVVQPLFFVACKCRDRVLRKTAVQAMEKVTGDGFYDARLLTRVARRVIKIEESATDGVVKEEDRLHDIELDFAGEAHSCRITAWRRRPGEERVVVHATLDG